MHLKEKTKSFIHKSIKNMKSLLFLTYEKLPNTASCNPLLCGRGSMTKHRMDRYYTELCNEWECDLDMALKSKRKRRKTSLAVTEIDGCDESSQVKHLIMSSVKKKEEEEKAKNISDLKKGGEQCSKRKDNRGYTLGKKMKELEMMDVGDVEHVLDVEEALHYYSRIKSPVYLDMVDKFFTDLCKDVSVPQASASNHSLKRRFSWIRL